MAFGGSNHDDEVMSEINMTPLVDVMLVLLIIFIITVPVITHSVNLDLPEADNTPTEPTPDTITIAVGAQGQLHWNSTAVSFEELESRLANAAASQPQPPIHLRGDRAVPYEYVAKTMAAVQRAGIQSLGFITEPGS
ncbi:ExbD/TolR family protein [Saccharospirillum mangrovi]|uniref:ExbD/TolR family protein n=1 Tax=Saccharospirillum mangrovi TaxID=2161747 RepID=UPI000D35FB68|nr:biopolymer transporter ExbD [Saccharospirillum mangrovi]